MINFVGQFTLGEGLPGAFALGATAMADVQARLAALIALQAQIALTLPTISFAANIQLCADAIASMEAAISLGVTPPNIDAQLAIVAASIAELTATLSFAASIMLAFSAPGVWSHTYSGNADQLGPEFTTEFAAGLPGGGGASEHIDAVLISTNLGPTWTAIQQVFAT